MSMDFLWKLTSLIWKSLISIFLPNSNCLQISRYVHTSQLIVIISKPLFQMILLRGGVSSATSFQNVFYLFPDLKDLIIFDF